MPKYEYKVVRSFGPGSSKCSDSLTEAFNEGWEFVRASDYIPNYDNGRYTYYGFIEYVLRREKE